VAGQEREEIRLEKLAGARSWRPVMCSKLVTDCDLSLGVPIPRAKE
jgi:hypothetical protein